MARGSISLLGQLVLSIASEHLPEMREDAGALRFAALGRSFCLKSRIMIT